VSSAALESRTARVSDHAQSAAAASKSRPECEQLGSCLHGGDLWEVDESRSAPRRDLLSRDEARLSNFTYIETFYNPRRRHTSLGGISPDEYERRFQKSQQPIEFDTIQTTKTV
jgi:transposase InsO family protein